MPATAREDPSERSPTWGGWATGPPDPRLAEGAVHLWRADLSSVGEELLELLSTQELARARGFLRDADGRLWARAHAVLRALLGRYLQSDPRALRFAAGAHGKPSLLGGDGQPTPAFNLSHSGSLAVYAFSASEAVGVDVECARGARDEVAIAARALGAAEARRLQALAPAARAQEFRRAWTRHEAKLKWRGTGIGADAASAPGPAPWIAELQMGPRAAGALAVGRRPRELRCWEWPAGEPTAG